MPEIILKGTELLEKWAEQKNKSVKYAMEIAVKNTVINVRKEMVSKLRSGALGLSPTTQMRANRRKSKNPLAKLAVGILYKFDKRNLKATIGFHGDTLRTRWALDYADRSDNPYTLVYTDRLREVLHRAGIHLKKTTKSAQVPMRDILGNFFSRYQRYAMTLLKENFRRKLAGERI